MKKRLKIYNVRRRKSSLHEKGETMEEKLAVLYNKMASAIISLIPVEWEEIYYLGEVEEGKKSWSSVFFFKDLETQKYIKSHDITEIYPGFNMNYGLELNKIDNVLLEIYDCFLENHQPVWEQLKFNLKNTGDFKINFSYDVMKKSEYGQVEREIIWAYESFGMIPQNSPFLKSILDNYLKKNQKQRKGNYYFEKKKMAIAIIVFFIVDFIGWFVVKDLRQEKKMKEEIANIQQMLNQEQINMDSIIKKLTHTITTGEYSKVERAIKNYLADNINAMITIDSVLNGDTIENALTAENYQNDGPDFVKTRQILKDMKNKLTSSKETMVTLSQNNTVMSYLKNVDDSYYIDLYKEMMGEKSTVDDIKNIEKNIDDVVNLIQSQQNVLKFLSENKNMWNVQNGKIQFDDDNLLNQYNQLLLAVQ